MADKKITAFLKIIARRKNIQKWITGVSWCMLVAVALAFILNVIAVFIPVYNAPLYGWIIMLAGLLSSLLYVIIRHTSMYEAARYADSAGLKERLITSISFIGSDNGFAGLLKEDTVYEIGRFDKKLRLPFVYPWKRYLIAGILSCMFIICIFVPSQAKKDAANLHKLAMQAKEVKDTAEKAIELLDKPSDNGLEKAEAAKLKKILEEAKQELVKATDENGIKKAKERLASKLKQELAEADSQKLIKAAQPLVPDANLAQMADFNKKLADMAQKGGINKELADELRSAAESLTPEQMEKLLESLKEAMKDGDITAAEAAEALSGINSRDAQMAAATITASSKNSSSGSQGSALSPSASPSAAGSLQSPGSTTNPSASAASGSGSGSGTGPGNGNGQGNGSGNGSGQGNGSGRGNGSGGPGWNTGSSEGLERTEQEGKGEVVYLTDKKQGNDANLTGKKNGDAKITEKSGQQGGAQAGSKADLDTVIGDYSSEAYAKADSNKVPSAMKDIVKEYFSGFNE